MQNNATTKQAIPPPPVLGTVAPAYCTASPGALKQQCDQARSCEPSKVMPCKKSCKSCKNKPFSRRPNTLFLLRRQPLGPRSFHSAGRRDGRVLCCLARRKNAIKMLRAQAVGLGFRVSSLAPRVAFICNERGLELSLPLPAPAGLRMSNPKPSTSRSILLMNFIRLLIRSFRRGFMRSFRRSFLPTLSRAINLSAPGLLPVFQARSNGRFIKALLVLSRQKYPGQVQWPVYHGLGRFIKADPKPKNGGRPPPASGRPPPGIGSAKSDPDSICRAPRVCILPT